MPNGKGLDTPQIHTLMPIATTFKQEGYTWVAGYYFQDSRYKQLLTKAAAQVISQAGLYLVSLWENGDPTDAQYFTAAQGREDAARAFLFAQAANQPAGTPIYATVDGDITDLDAVTAYFTAFRHFLQSCQCQYLTGVYGSGLVCRAIIHAGLAHYSWVSGSRGWSGYADWLPHADIVQTAENQSAHGISFDANVSNGSAGGWKL